MGKIYVPLKTLFLVYNGEKNRDIFVLLTHEAPSEKGFTLKVGNVLPFHPLRIDSFSEGRQNGFDKVASLWKCLYSQQDVGYSSKR